MSDPVLYDASDGIATLRIDRPDRRNAADQEVVARLREGLAAAEADAEVRVLVITGTGDSAFCSGADLAGVSSEAPVQQHHRRAEIGRLFGKMRRARLPIVARVNGVALAGGFGLMLACDLVVAAEEAEMGLPEIDIGLWPFMVTAMTHRDIPRKVALELMMTGRRMGAREGERWGFVNRVVSRSDLDAATEELAGALASKSPLIMTLGKTSFYASEDQRFDDAIEYLAGMLSVCVQSEDTTEGVSAFFQKRAPEWKGR